MLHQDPWKAVVSGIKRILKDNLLIASRPSVNYHRFMLIHNDGYQRLHQLGLMKSWLTILGLNLGSAGCQEDWLIIGRNHYCSAKDCR